MIFRIRHATHFKYEKPAYESHNEVRVAPRSSAGQRCLSFALEVVPPAAVLEYEDSFRNRVHALSVHPPHDELSIVATSVVERVPPRAGSPLRVPFAEFLAEDAARSAEHFEFLNPSQHVPFSDRLRRFFWSTRPAPTETVVEYVVRVVRYVRDQFEYEKDKTHVHSSVDDILSAGGGVCQDFAHLTIGLLRLAGLPARYVSGYLAPRAGAEVDVAEQASHAWIEALLPGAGWTGFDPTLRGRTTDHHIRVAVGRDYSDVPPLRGVYRSAGAAGDMRVELSIQREDGDAVEPPPAKPQSQSQQQ
jgi:transglutaminase-like putative cysteine protease